MTDKEALYKETASLVKTGQMIYERAYSDYSARVASVLKEQPSQKQAEKLLDGLLDFCSDKRFQTLFRRLCKHIYKYYPGCAIDYIMIYREQMEESESNEL